ncbi:hypothetical protein AVEN_175165-1 [Araneus ventricosus]|uniref:Uncharacterized protein n=1 Tax=Araneus ventricosus TaxID=182803 RepID=A0A4Y2LVY1_ARAVE|nr:hypothetical protein AVEN_175165-1 [Araneus ventricosus]
MTRTTPELAPPLKASAHTLFNALTPVGSAWVVSREGVWPLRMINVQQAQYTMDHQWNRVSNLEPPGPKAETLPLDHRGLHDLGQSFHRDKRPGVRDPLPPNIYGNHKLG